MEDRLMDQWINERIDHEHIWMDEPMSEQTNKQTEINAWLDG